MALPVLGGLLIADEVVDVFLPVRFYRIRRGRWLKLQKERRRDVQLKREAIKAWREEASVPAIMV